VGAQIKRTLIATLIGLAIAIAIAAINTLSAGHLDLIDPFQPLNPGIMGYWVGRLGLIPLIAAIGAMIIGFKKYGVSVSIFSFMGTLVGLVVVICGLVAVVAAAYPVAPFPFAAPGPARDEFVRGTAGSCFKTQRAVPANRPLADADLQKYCQCAAEALASQTSREDIDYRQKNGTFAPATVSRMTQAAGACRQGLRK
jgi:hypothetical protein